MPFKFDIPAFESVPRLDVTLRSIKGEGESRILFVSDYVPYSDFSDDRDDNKATLLGAEEGQVFKNILEYVTRKHPDGSRLDLRELTVFNWSNADDLKGLMVERNLTKTQAQNYAERYNNARLLAFIRKMKPDIVIMSGMDAFKSFMTQYQSDHYPVANDNFDFKNKFGRLLKFKHPEIDPFKIIGTVDIRRCATQKQKEIKKYTNLIGFLVEAFELALHGRNRNQIDLSESKFCYIDTYKKFCKFYKRLMRASRVSIDSEGRSLARIANKLFSIQFALNRTDSYFLPLDHPDSPFTASELIRIKKALRHYFERGKSKWHIYQFARHDVEQFIAQLGVRYYNHRIYDCMAGEFALDENRKLLQKKGGTNSIEKPYALQALAEKYGCDIYSRIPFSKGDREGMENVKFTSKVIKYGCYDVLAPWQIMECQIAEAARTGNTGFMQFVLGQLSDTVLAVAQMEHTGAPLDKKYLFSLKSADSDLDKQIRETVDKMWELPSVKKTNRLLIQAANIPQGFTEPRVFAPTKELSKQTLFFKVLKLAPLKFSQKGGGSVDKEFKNHYKEKVPEVKLLDDYEQLTKLKSTYVNAFYEKLTKDPDCIDGFIRANYDYTDVTTGRLSSSKPNLQNIVNRGILAKTIKRCFVALAGWILCKNDYSAHEVRIWAILGKDKRLAEAFRKGLRLRQALRILLAKYPNEAAEFRALQKKVNWKKIEEYDDKVKIVNKLDNEIVKRLAALTLEIEQFGDIHRINYNHFYGTPILKITGEQRQSIKAVVFGVIYGKTAKGLAATKGIDTEENAEKLIKLLFNKFKGGGDWINKIKAFAQKNFYVKSPVGMIRHLWAYLHNKPGVRNAMDRRGPNSIIQGLASQMGVASIRIMQKLIWKLFISRGHKIPWKVLTNFVHDSLESMCQLHLLPIHLYLLEHAGASQIHKLFTEKYGMKFNVGLELEFQMGPTMSDLITWGWSSGELRDVVNYTMDWQEKEFNVRFRRNSIMRAFETNLAIITKLREKELRAAKMSGEPEMNMSLTTSNVDDIGFAFQVDGGMFKKEDNDNVLERMAA